MTRPASRRRNCRCSENSSSAPKTLADRAEGHPEIARLVLAVGDLGTARIAAEVVADERADEACAETSLDAPRRNSAASALVVISLSNHGSVHRSVTSRPRMQESARLRIA